MSTMIPRNPSPDRHRLRSISKAVLTRVLRTRGWVALPQWRLPHLPLEEHLKKLFALYKIDCVLDVGANTGQFRDLLRDGVGYVGPILSFEPVSSYVTALRARAAEDSSWRIYPWALGRSSEVKTITLFSSPGLPSLLAPNLAAMQQILPRAGTTVTGTEQVTVRRLDEVFQEAAAGMNFRNVFVKLDTQGYDMEVIEGAGKLLDTFTALQTELSVLPIYEAMPDYRAALQTLVERGFAISGMFPVNHDAALRVIDMDCVMVRKA